MLSSVTVSLEALSDHRESLLARVFAQYCSPEDGHSPPDAVDAWAGGSEHWERNVQYKEPTINIKSLVSRIKPVPGEFSPTGASGVGRNKITGLGHASGTTKESSSDVRDRDHLLDDIKKLEPAI